MAEETEVHRLAGDLGEELHKRRWHATAAESCSGIAATAITFVPGAYALPFRRARRKLGRPTFTEMWLICITNVKPIGTQDNHVILIGSA